MTVSITVAKPDFGPTPNVTLSLDENVRVTIVLTAPNASHATVTNNGTPRAPKR